MSKAAIRAEARAFLRALSPAERAAAEAEIARRVWEVPEVAGARTLLLYASLPEEVGTDAIADEARRRGIALVYPRCLPEGRMVLHQADSSETLRPGRFGIREPDEEAAIREVADIDAALIPGLAWDREGHRLGRGGGYYDRLLAHPEWRGFRCGLFFAAQETSSVPREAWDIRLDAIVTEKEIVSPAGRDNSIEDFATLLKQTWNSGRPHVERLTWAAAIISTALHKAGMRATLVGGGAIEFHAPGAYTTSDLDFVVEYRPRSELDRVLRSLGFGRSGRHWILDDLYVEVPGNFVEDPVVTEVVGPFELRVMRKEILLGERIVGFRHAKTWAHGLQAIALIRAFGSEIDEAVLRKYLRREGSEDAYELLRGVADSDAELTWRQLDALWQKHYR